MEGLGRELTEKEKITLCALVRHPKYNDRELADVTKLNLSTVTAIRRRLSKTGYYFTIRIPMVQYLGAELLCVAYGKLSETMPREERDNRLAKFVNDNNRIFHAFTSDDSAVMLCISNNYTELKGDVDDFQRFLSSNDFISGDTWEYVLFPFEVSNLINLFDYSFVLRQVMIKEQCKVPKLDLKYKKIEKRSLTSKEKSVLMSLVQNPTLPDNSVAKKVGVSRQALSNMRQRFEADGLIKTMNIPNVAHIGCEILILSHVLFNPNSLLEDRKKGVELLLEGSPLIFDMSGSFEAVLMHVVENYDAFNFYRNKMISYYTSQNFLRGEPKLKLYPVKKINYLKNLNFTGVLQNVL
jgi:DNA-binding MarR family transcriptional regulator